MSTQIGVVDLDVGNLRSVENAVSQCGFDVSTVRAAADLARVTHLILPGVGSYAAAIDRMRAQGLVAPLAAFAKSGRPVLGICLGMQLLATRGDEGGGADGLGLVPGAVIRFDPSVAPAIPHVGWNEARIAKPHPVFSKVKSGVDFYYVHSFHFVCERDTDRVAIFEYGGSDYTSAVASGSVIGVQFHPEKSQSSGLRLLENFCNWSGIC